MLNYSIYPERAAGRAGCGRFQGIQLSLSQLDCFKINSANFLSFITSLQEWVLLGRKCEINMTLNRQDVAGVSGGGCGAGDQWGLFTGCTLLALSRRVQTA
ncbi:hypothetical protein J6590_061804 [Homalodisca vitripennis]|nr:hypothetical protein J6590_061804 [Homalodisca vitripennis]